MAIEPCVECGKRISTTAEKCPHCGSQYPTLGYRNRFAVSVLVVIILAAMILYCGFNAFSF